MPQMMQAAVVAAFGESLTLREWPVPTAAPGQILGKTEAYAVCHTDLHAARGDWLVKPVPPFIPGHEGLTIVKAADRVDVPWMQPRSAINDVFDRLDRGQVPSRVALDFGRRA